LQKRIVSGTLGEIFAVFNGLIKKFLGIHIFHGLVQHENTPSVTTSGQFMRAVFEYVIYLFGIMIYPIKHEL
jgi:hypothetical protein